MQQAFWHKIKRFLPIIFLVLIEILIVATNYTPNTFLMGWDNVMPEFNFRQAFITNIFGVWQEHRGVGLPDGMGHAASLVHTAFLFILSLALPQSVLRYSFHFLMHLFGMIGVFRMIREIWGKEKNNNVLALLGALFYGLNLITIQMFYTPLEAFSVHFAALPWLALTLMRYYQDANKHNLIYFGVVVLLSTPQFFIPTLLLPTTLLLIAISMPFIKLWKRVLTAGTVFLCVNAFWLLPYLYNISYNAPIIQRAKINQMSSDEVYARNQVFGDIKNVLLMRGFMLDFEDVNTDSQPIFVMDTWRTWVNQPLIQYIGVFFALCTIAGLFTKVVNLTPTGATLTTSGFKIIWLLSFILLANNTPYLSNVMEWLRTHIPLFAEAYRFPFTKFGLLYGFASTILIVNFFSFARRPLLKLVLVVLIFAAAFPVFQGQFFYDALRVKLPKEYTKLFTFMDKQDHNGRIAYLPQPSYWSWKHYKFGLVGSGFLWYGLAQPLMDRAFDPWSNVNENYYWELTNALYSNDSEKLHAVLLKYDIRYIVYDKNIWAQSNDRALLGQDLPTLLASLPTSTIINHLDTITVYERTLPTNAFMRTTNALPIITPYTWTDNDVAYKQVGDYVTKQTDDSNRIIYPFRSLFTKRAIDEREFTVHETPNTITLASIDDVYATYSAMINKEKNHVFEASTSSTLIPQAVKPCGVLKQGAAHGEIYDHSLRMSTTNQRACLSIGSPTLSHQDGYLLAVENRHIKGGNLTVSVINNTAKHVELETILKPTMNTIQVTKNEWQTDYFILPPLASDGLGYTFYFTNDSIGNNETVNDLKRINIYTLPYQKMVETRINTNASYNDELLTGSDPVNTNAIISVDHPNPAYYKVTLDQSNTARTLILSQSFHKGWIAFSLQNKQFLPHVLINNWENGWILEEIYKPANDERAIIIFFWPQALEYLGLGILILTGIIIFFPARNAYA